MSGLFNPFAFSVLGQALTPPVPPALRVMDGQATGQQLALAQQAFHGFCALTRTSAVPNPTQQGRLADGTPYKIHVNGRVATMQIWADPRHRGITEIEPHEEDCGERPLYPSMPTPIVDYYGQYGYWKHEKREDVLGIEGQHGEVINYFGKSEWEVAVDHHYYAYGFLQSDAAANGGGKNAGAFAQAQSKRLVFTSRCDIGDAYVIGEDQWSRDDYTFWPQFPSSTNAVDYLIETIGKDYTEYVAPFLMVGPLTLVNGYILYKNGVPHEDKRNFIREGDPGFPVFPDLAGPLNTPKIARLNQIEESNRVTYAEFEKKRDAWIKCVGTNLEHYMRIAKEENDPGFTPVYIHI